MAMTDKEAGKLRLKIKKIKEALAADKRRCGGYYDDSHGLRYKPLQYYIKLADFGGGLRYLRWFHKNFPDDIGYPDFLFEWTIMLFKTGKIKEAEKKAFETFCSNTYLFDKFFGRPVSPIEKWETSNLETADFALNNFYYASNQENLSDFAEWLDDLTRRETFARLQNKYIDIYKRLFHERDHEIRGYLLKQAKQLENEL